MGVYPYIHVLNQNWPKKLHYEFTSRDEDHVGIELHYEKRKSWESSGAKEVFDICCGKYIDYKYKKYTMEHTPRNGHGICIQVSVTEDSNTIASLMNTFVDETIGKINQGVTV